MYIVFLPKIQCICLVALYNCVLYILKISRCAVCICRRIVSQVTATECEKFSFYVHNTDYKYYNKTPTNIYIYIYT